MKGMDCCSSSYGIDFNKHHQHMMNANSPANTPFYPPMYNSHHPIRYPSHRTAIHPTHYGSIPQPPHNDEILGTSYRMGGQQQSFYDVAGGVNSNANVYDRYDNTNFPNNSYGNYSAAFNSYGGPLKDCYSSQENASGSYFHHYPHSQNTHLQPQSSPYYGSPHPYDSYRNISANFPYHHHPVQPTPSHPANPFNYQTPPNIHREFYPCNSEYYNNSNNNTRYYPTPPPSAPPIPLPFSQPLRESYPIRDPGQKMPTIPPPARSFPHMDPLYSAEHDLKHSSRNVNRSLSFDNHNANESTTIDPPLASPKSLPPPQNSSNENSPNGQDNDQQKSIKTPLSPPHSSESPQPQKQTELQTEDTTNTRDDSKSEQQREKNSPTSTPSRPQSPHQQNQLEKQTTERETKTSSIFENNVESNTNQNNSRQQITPTTCATGN